MDSDRLKIRPGLIKVFGSKENIAYVHWLNSLINSDFEKSPVDAKSFIIYDKQMKDFELFGFEEALDQLERKATSDLSEKLRNISDIQKLELTRRLSDDVDEFQRKIHEEFRTSFEDREFIKFIKIRIKKHEERFSQLKNNNLKIGEDTDTLIDTPVRKIRFNCNNREIYIIFELLYDSGLIHDSSWNRICARIGDLFDASDRRGNKQTIKGANLSKEKNNIPGSTYDKVLRIIDKEISIKRKHLPP